MSKKTVGAKYEYELSNRLGQGAFAEVYKGKNKVTGEVVAIKVIKRSLLAKYGDDILKQIHTEVSVLQKLVTAMRSNVCPFINKIFECLETPNNIYIVLEFCNQGTLLDKIKKQRKLPEDEAIFIFFQLITALDFLCENQIAHRDIKPENVFIKDGIFKLGDFGFAGQKSLYQTHLGTYPYMAPEFFNSNSYDGNQIDIWALGLLFHEILFGEIYFIGSSQYEVSQKILNKQYVLGTSHVLNNKEIRDLLPRMVEKDKNKRITAKQILQLPIFLRYKNDPRYVAIMDNEKQYWATNMQQSQQQQSQEDAQKEQEERLKREELEKERLRQLKLEQEKQEIKNMRQQQLPKAKDVINEMRNGVMIMVKLCEYLQMNFNEVCRYDIFYILKQAFQQLHRLKEKLDAAHQFTSEDHKGFSGIDPQIWDYFYQDNSIQSLITDVEFDKNVIRKSYIDQINYLNNWTSTKYPVYIGDLQSVADMNIENGIDEVLYLNQLSSTIKFLKSELTKGYDQLIQDLIKKTVIWMFVVSFPKDLVAGRNVNVSRFIHNLDADNLNGMKECLYAQ